MDLIEKNFKKLIKNDNRLASFKPPLDGFVKKPKKQFVPNLNITRKKHVVEERPKRKEATPSKSIKSRKNDSQRFIQSSGIFTEGFNNDQKKVLHIKRERDDTTDSVSNLSMPVIRKNDWEINRKLEDDVINKLMSCDEIPYDEKLPFKPVFWQNFQSKNQMSAGKENECEFLNSDSYSDENPSLSLWQLPDSFSGKAFSDNECDRELKDYCLSDMPPGQIGKLIIRQSGKMEVQIGDMKLCLDETFQSWAEEVVVLDKGNGCDDKMQASVLGEISNRFILYPDWDSLLSE